jgi:hypothetical protein
MATRVSSAPNILSVFVCGFGGSVDNELKSRTYEKLFYLGHGKTSNSSWKF